MKFQMLRLAAAGIVSVALLAGCGGGGGDSAAPPSTPANSVFALSAGYKARVASGANESFNLSGSCSGTATINTNAAAPSTFEGVSGFAAGQISTVNFTNCTPAASSATGTTYYNADSVNIGLSIVGGEYSKFESPPSQLPASVKVGDTAVFATLTTYADSTKAVPTGKRVLSYMIESDTTTTAIANIITRSYDLSNQLLATQQSRYRMAETGALTLASIDVQFSTTSSIHLIYTPR